MRRLVVILLAMLLLAAAPAEASKRSAWKRVLRTHDAAAPADGIVVTPGHLGRTAVTVHLRARRTNTDPVLFPDSLYGAIAWHWTGKRWRRVDAARVRPALVRELAPGESAKVELPLQRRLRRVRVLVPVRADHAGAWADVRG